MQPFPPPPGLPATPLGVNGLAHINNAEDAVREFQALLITQLLKTARESGKLHESDDSMTGDEGYLEIAEQQFARVLAERDFLSLSRLMLDGLGELKRQANSGPADSRFPG